MVHYQCLPIKLRDTDGFRVPERLKWVEPLLKCIHGTENKYVYLTVRRTYITEGYSGSRDGWHSDGFLTKDINYIWYDCLPTEFAVQDFDVDENCSDSLRQFEEQVDMDNVITYRNKTLLRLDSSVIHRPAKNTSVNGIRTFIKVSVSNDRYNLVGNSHNYLLDYKWDMVDRDETRNHQSK